MNGSRQITVSRERLRAVPCTPLVRGRQVKADLSIYQLPECAVVVKDFADKSLWVRLLGRLQIARERRAYRHLDGVAGLPQFFGRVDADAIALEWIDGEVIDDESATREQYRRLVMITESMHRRGVCHWDLRARRNLLSGSDGSLYVVDFGSAVHIDPGGWWGRRLFGLFSTPDRSALLKWKRLWNAGELTDQEARFEGRFESWRRWWPFNRKRNR